MGRRDLPMGALGGVGTVERLLEILGLADAVCLGTQCDLAVEGLLDLLIVCIGVIILIAIIGALDDLGVHAQVGQALLPRVLLGVPDLPLSHLGGEVVHGFLEAGEAVGDLEGGVSHQDVRLEPSVGILFDPIRSFPPEPVAVCVRTAETLMNGGFLPSARFRRQLGLVETHHVCVIAHAIYKTVAH